jgi:uncharacterized protein (TIGR00730 family)
MIWQRIKLTTYDAFKLAHVFGQLVYGMWRISKIPQPIVTIFGGSRFPTANFYFQQAHQVAQQLVNEDISVLTGGGPGIMQAASCDITLPPTGKGKIIGIGVKDLQDEPNMCAQEYFELDYFFARKWLLINYSKAFIIFPGGYGTLDELFELLTLIQTKKLSPPPIILIGTEYWHGFMEWFKKEVVKHGLISTNDLGIFTVTDDLHKAYCIARDVCNL